jgi:hypothetical protein
MAVDRQSAQFVTASARFDTEAERTILKARWKTELPSVAFTDTAALSTLTEAPGLAGELGLDGELGLPSEWPPAGAPSLDGVPSVARVRWPESELWSESELARAGERELDWEW